MLPFKVVNGVAVDYSPEEIAESAEIKGYIKAEMQQRCQSEIKALSEDKAHSIAAKKTLGIELTQEETDFLATFITLRDDRIRQYEQEKIDKSIAQ